MRCAATVVWGRLRDEAPHPPADHHSFAEHAAIVEAIEERDLAAAASRMRHHLETVQALLLTSAAALGPARYEASCRAAMAAGSLEPDVRDRSSRLSGVALEPRRSAR